MALYPAVQRKAQAEIDAVIGPNRLPDYGDQGSLPYINAMVKETMRWQLVAPIGTNSPPKIASLYLTRTTAVGHKSTSDDEYNGYLIPRGTVVLGNAWRVSAVSSLVVNLMAHVVIHTGPYYTIPRYTPPLRNINRNVG
jgi:hypothetical protein